MIGAVGAEVDEVRSAAAGRLIGTTFVPRPDELIAAGSAGDARRMATFWLLVVAICHRTARWSGAVDGVERTGSDFLIAAARRSFRDRPEAFTAATAGRASESELAALFIGDDGASRLDRGAERLALWRSTGDGLCRRFGGDANGIWERAGGRVETSGGAVGIADLLGQFRAYSDPARKKINLVLLVLEASGAWPLADPRAVGVAVDYHVTRVALRVGLVRLGDAVRERLREGAPMTRAQDAELRGVVGRACDAVVEAARPLSVLGVDNALWSVGRSCCTAERAWCNGCGSRRQALVDRFDVPAGDGCPLAPVCRGAEEPAFRTVREPAVDTHFH